MDDILSFIGIFGGSYGGFMSYLVDINEYVLSMKSRWSDLGNTSNHALEDAWKSMGVTLNAHIQGKEKKWSVLQLPTGTGKTQGLAVFCAELSKLKEHCGVLIITRLTDEANKLCELVNQLSNSSQAVTSHSFVEVSDSEINQSPVLIVTHDAYLRALKEFDIVEEDSERWTKLVSWVGGTRKLTIIDETLNSVDYLQVTLDEIQLVRGFISYELQKKFPDEVEALNIIISLFEELVESSNNEQQDVRIQLWSDLPSNNLLSLGDAIMRGNQAKSFCARFDNLITQEMINSHLKSILRRTSRIISTWSIYSKIGDFQTLATACTSLPAHLHSAVILDATASRSNVYKLLAEVVDLHQLPQPINKLRKYDNVTLNIHYGYNVGKTELVKKPAKHFIDTLQKISPDIKRKSDFLFIVPKDVEEKIEAMVKQSYPLCSMAHWGALDGRNDWDNLDTIVLYGLPYLGNSISACSVAAYKNWYGKAKGIYDPFITVVEIPDGSGDEEIQYYENLEEDQDYERGYIEVSLIQAVNRIRCRSPIDDQGNCDPCTIHLLLLRKGKWERGILEAFESLMPNIKIKEHYEIDASRKRKVPKQGQAIINYLEGKPDGRYLVSEITTVPSGTLENYIVLYKEGNNAFAQAMSEIGVVEYDGAQGKSGGFVIKRNHKKGF